MKTKTSEGVLFPLVPMQIFRRQQDGWARFHPEVDGKWGYDEERRMVVWVRRAVNRELDDTDVGTLPDHLDAVFIPKECLCYLEGDWYVGSRERVDHIRQMIKAVEDMQSKIGDFIIEESCPRVLDLVDRKPSEKREQAVEVTP